MNLKYNIGYIFGEKEGETGNAIIISESIAEFDTETHNVDDTIGGGRGGSGSRSGWWSTEVEG